MFNKTLLLGNLGKDPELKELKGGKKVCAFPLATTEFGKDGEKHTEWHNIECWDKAAENVTKYLKKGSSVFVEGAVATDKYEKDGETKYYTKIKSRRIVFLDKKGETTTTDDF